MIRVPESLWSYLDEARAFRHVLAYEVELAGRPLELLVNGSLDAWTGATPDSFTKTGDPAAGGILEETGQEVVRTPGGSCAKFTRTTTGALSLNQTMTGLAPSTWYLASWWWKMDTGTATTPKTRLRVLNNTTSEEVGDDGETWHAVGTPYFYEANGVEGWHLHRHWFKTAASHTKTDTFEVRLVETHTGAASDVSQWADDFSVTGPYQAPSLYLSSQELTWGGQDYSRLAVKQRPITERMRLSVPEAKLTLSNVNQAMRQYLEPDDMLTGGRLTVRLLFKDASQVLEGESLVQFVGRLERPRKATDTEFALTAVALSDGAGVPVPRRRFHRWCAWEFADGVDCKYTSSTTTTNTGTDATNPTVASGAALANGDLIQIGNQPEVAITAGGGTTSLTIAAARTWGNGDAVALTRCGREFADCEVREREHEFGGFRGIAAVTRLVFRGTHSGKKGFRQTQI